jgi:protein O-GlcNAc transferase
MATSDTTVTPLPPTLEGALQLYNTNLFTQAKIVFEQLDAKTPNSPEILIGLGMSYWKCNELDTAEQKLRRALELNPLHDIASRSLAIILHSKKQFTEAEEFARKAVKLSPQVAQHIFTLGVTVAALGKFDEALDYYHQALAINPRYPEALHNIGVIKLFLRDMPAAIKFFTAALSAKPHYPDAYKNLASALKESGSPLEALALLRYLVNLDPQRSESWRILGSFYRDTHHNIQASESYRKAIELNPQNYEAMADLAIVLRDEGQTLESRALYGVLIEQLPHPISFRIRKALTFPLITNSAEEIELIRTQMNDELDEINELPQTIADPLTEINLTNFYTAYHGLNDRLLQTKIASTIINKTPTVSYTAPHLAHWRSSDVLSIPNTSTTPASSIEITIPYQIPRLKRKIKVGVCSRHLVNHTVGSLWGDLFAHLDKEAFELYVFYNSPTPIDPHSLVGQRAQKSIFLPLDLMRARSIIADYTLDILFYPDIGMEPLTYFLSFSRLAPIQCVTWGHPVTTGVPTIDYFVSSRHLEVENAQSHYSESLITLPTLNTLYNKPEHIENVCRKELGIPEQGTLYTCPQSLFKLHPDMDYIFRRILQADPRNILAVPAGNFPGLVSLLMQRFEKSLPDVIKQIVVVPPLTQSKFLGLIALSDVMLDPIHFGGGMTTLQALALGTPVVTLPGKFMRSRISVACYKQIGYEELIASDPEHYVQIAVRLGREVHYRSGVKDTLQRITDPLFTNMNVVNELEAFLIEAIRNYSTKPTV